MGDITEEITYFEYCGEINTGKTLSLAKKRCKDIGIKKLVIASATVEVRSRPLKFFRG